MIVVVIVPRRAYLSSRKDVNEWGYEGWVERGGWRCG
jgi:hypothetical protein